MPDVTQPQVRYIDACRAEVEFTSEMLDLCLRLLDHPQSADEMRIAAGTEEGYRLIDSNIEPLTILRKMWEGFLVIPQSTPPIGSTVWFITGRGQSILNGRAQWFREYYDREDPMKTAVLRLMAP